MLPCNSDHCCLKIKLKLQKKKKNPLNCASLQASTTVQLRFLLFCVVAQHMLVVCYQRFWTTCWSHTDTCPEMSVINYTVVKFLKINIKKSYNRILIKFCTENLHQQVRQYQKSITQVHALCHCPQILRLTKISRKILAMQVHRPYQKS